MLSHKGRQDYFGMGDTFGVNIFDFNIIDHQLECNFYFLFLETRGESSWVLVLGYKVLDESIVGYFFGEW